MKLGILLGLTVVVTIAYAASNVLPATVTDSYGNVANSDSQITWGEIPAGQAYEVNPEEFSYDGLKPLFDAMHGFVAICFGSALPLGKYVR